MDLKKVNNILFDNDEESKRSNSNKNTTMIGTSRCVAIEEYVKELSLDNLPEDIKQAHQNGEIYIHDLGFGMMPFINCCLINLQDMLDNGTVLNEIKIESPKSFQTACNLTIQFMFGLASMMYGGKTIPMHALSKYLKITEDKFKEKYKDENIVKQLLADELKSGIQTMYYQTLTLISNQDGQGIFSTWYMELKKEDPYLEYTKMIVDEVLRQKIKGMPNAQGIPHSTAMPKLVMLLNPLLINEYKDTYKLALECISKRSMPDFVSEKVLKRNHNGQTFGPMGCRSFLSDRQDENGEYKYWGRFNRGVASINIPRIAFECKEEGKDFFKTLKERAELCKKVLERRTELLRGTKAERVPLLFMGGAIARLEADEVIDPYLEGGYSTASLGYVGIHEALMILYGYGIETEEGHNKAIEIVQALKSYCDEWNAEKNMGYSVYGTPAETLVYKFNQIDKEKYGDNPEYQDIFKHKYYTNSFHINVRTEIDAFNKLKKEADFQTLSSGGCISFIECGDLTKNLPALDTLSWFMYNTCQYAEFNMSNMDVCSTCNFVGKLDIENDKRKCPQCGEKDIRKLVGTRRICGYLTTNLPNKGKMNELLERVYHI